MSKPEIIRKLAEELDRGITTEVQVVYVLAGVRKLIERDHIENRYADLRFHCDWALHSSMSRAAAKAILRQFDAAYPLLRDSGKLHELPSELRYEIDRISKMRSFNKELAEFLDAYGLPPLTKNRPDGWTHFLHLYTKVIEDIPLAISVPREKKAEQGPPLGTLEHISHVTVHFEQRPTIKHDQGEEVVYAMAWWIHDKNGEPRSISIFNSFSKQT
jgi:hypothetical protein